MGSFRRIGMVLLGGILWAAVSIPQIAAQGFTVLKQGWTYNIGLPESLHDKESPALGLASGINTYRVVGFGGDTWYRLQRVYRHPKGGWYTPQGAKQVWVNISYAYTIDEVLR
jgi:hypothetical protein